MSFTSVSSKYQSYQFQVSARVMGGVIGVSLKISFTMQQECERTWYLVHPMFGQT